MTTTLAEMVTFISSRVKDVNKVRIDNASVVDAVNQAIQFWKRKTFWFNEFEESITIAAGAHSFVLVDNTPLFLLNPGGMVISQNNMRWPTRKVSSGYYDRINREGTGRPYCYVFRNNAFETYFYADQDYTAICRGIKDYADFLSDGSDDGSSNDWTDLVPDLIKYEALVRLHGEVLQDAAQAAVFQKAVDKEYNDLKDFMTDKAGTGEIEIHSLLI